MLINDAKINIDVLHWQWVTRYSCNHVKIIAKAAAVRREGRMFVNNCEARAKCSQEKHVERQTGARDS